MKLYAVVAPARVSIGPELNESSLHVIRKDTLGEGPQLAIYTSKTKAESYRDYMIRQYPDVGYQVVETEGSTNASAV